MKHHRLAVPLASSSIRLPAVGSTRSAVSPGRRIRLGRFGLLLAVCFVLAAVPPIASGAGGAVTDISPPGQDAFTPDIALSSDGTRATAVWRGWDGTNFVVQSASATIVAGTATWGSVNNLSALGRNAESPKIALSSDGTRATAVWKRSDGTNTIVQSASATISAGTATWGAVTDLSATGGDAFEPEIGLSSDGTQATAVWSRYNGTKNIAQSASATISAGTATWSAVTDLSATGQSATYPHIALSSDGTRATAVWSRSNGTNFIAQSASATISAGTATWSAVTDLSATGGGTAGTRIVLSSDGTRATAVWHRNNGTNAVVQSASATISAGTATWGSVTDLSAPGQDALIPVIALSSDGTQATAVWWQYNGSNQIVQSKSATISAGTATWSAVTDLSAAGQDADRQSVALSSDGTRATASWIRSNGAHDIVQSASATISAGTATWGAVTDLSAAGHNADTQDIALSSDGTQALVVWSRYNGSTFVVQASGGGSGGGGGDDTPVSGLPRGAYCAASGNTWIFSGRTIAPGTFLNLEWEQILVDGHYFKATPAIFVVGKGLTCDPPPAGMKRDGYATGFYNVPAGIYPLYR